MGLTVWRIGLARARTLQEQAIGSTLFAGRWHSLRSGPRPRRVVYAASSRALAQLEKRVQAQSTAPVGQALFALELPADVDVGHARQFGLPDEWRRDLGMSQAFGDAWLDHSAQLALWVPSVVEPDEDNLLLNPEHGRFAEVRLSILRDPFVFDPRLA